MSAYPPGFDDWPLERRNAYFAEEMRRYDEEHAWTPKRGNGAGDATNRPTVKMIVGETERAVNELEALLVASDRGLYQRGGLIVSTGFAKMLTWDGKEVVGQVIETRGDYALAEDAEAVAKFVRLDEKGEPYPCSPPMALIRTLKDRKLRLRLPLLAGIVNCPSITVDGHLARHARLRSGDRRALSIRSASPSRACPTSPPGREPKPRWRAFWRCSTPSTSRPMTTGPWRCRLILSAIARRGLPFVPLHGFDAPVAGCGQVHAGRHRLDPRHRPRGGRHRLRQPRGGREAPLLDSHARRSDHRPRQLRSPARGRCCSIRC